MTPKFLSLKDKNQLLTPEILKTRQNRKISKIISQHKSKRKAVLLKLHNLRMTFIAKLNLWFFAVYEVFH